MSIVYDVGNVTIFLKEARNGHFRMRLSYVHGSVTNNNGFGIVWLDILILLLQPLSLPINYIPTASVPTLQNYRKCSVLVLCSTLSSLSAQLSSQWKYQSYITINGQSASLSWNNAHICGLRPDLYNCQTDEGLLIWQEDGSVLCQSHNQQY
jgi:hypothetical protein